MKKLFFASLWVLACLTAACSDEKDEPNGEIRIGRRRMGVSEERVLSEWKNDRQFYGCGGRG